MACRRCGTVLDKATDLTPTLRNQPEPPTSGGRLSRLAQARRAKEAAQGGPKPETSDLFSSLRSDAPPPPDYSSRMDEDDEADPTLSAALRQVRSEEDGEAAETPGDSATETFVPPPFEMPRPAPLPLPAVDPGQRLAALPDFGLPVNPPQQPTSPFSLSELGALMNAEAEPEAAFEAPSNPAIGEMGDDTSLPDWFDRDAAKASTSLPKRPEAVQEEAPRIGFSENTNSMPDWLRELSGSAATEKPLDESVAPRIGQTPEDTGELPDWLRNTGEKSERKPVNQPSGGPVEKKPNNPEIPDWLKQATGALPSTTRPSFGDVEVEQRLNFAFDETTDRAKEIKPGQVDHFGKDRLRQSRHTGLTDLLGLPPLRDDEEDEVQDQGTGLEAATAQTFQPAQAQPAAFNNFSVPDFPEPATAADNGLNLPDFPQSDFSQPATLYNGLAPWLEGLAPPRLDATAAASVAPTGYDLPPLPDLAPLPDSYDEPDQTEADDSRYSSSLVPWLVGLRPPAMDAFASTAKAPDLPDMLFGEDSTTENPPLTGENITDTRSFSVRDMFHQTDMVSQEFLPPVVAENPLEIDYETGQLPEWLRDEAGTSEAVLPPPPRFLSAGSMAPLALPPLPGDEMPPEDMETIPFEIPSFEGPVAPPNPTTLASVTGNQPLNYQLPDFLAEADSEPPLAISDSEMPSFLANLSPAPGKETIENDLPDFLTEHNLQAEHETLPDFLADQPSTPAFQSGADGLPDFLTQSPNFAVEMPGANAPLPDFLSRFEDDANPPLAAIDSPTSSLGNSLEFLRAEADANTAEAGSDEAIPDWLQAMTEGRSEIAAPKITTGYSPLATGSQDVSTDQQAELPEWLRTEAASASPVEPLSIDRPVFEQEAALPVEAPFSFELPPEPPATSPTPPVVAMPTSFAMEAPPSPAVSPSAEMNQFLAGLGDTGTDGLSSARLPSWLQEQSPENEIPEFKVPETGELPDWLNEKAANPAPASAKAPGPAEFGVDDPTRPDFDNFLSGAQPSFGSSNFLSDVEGPAWLRSSTQSKAPTAPLRTPEAPNPGGLPGWLRSVTPAATVEEENAPTTVGDSQFNAVEASDNRYTLPGITLPPQLASAAVLGALLAPTGLAIVKPATEKPPVVLPMGMRPEHLVRWGLSLLLLLAALVGLNLSLTTAPVAITPVVQSVYNEIDQLPANAKVLISFDWEADRYGEMRPLAQTLTAHVLAKRVRLVTFSLNPQGPALANGVLKELIDKDGYGNSTFYRYKENYLNLGWRSGQEVALRSLAQNMGDMLDYRENAPASTTPVMSGINGLADFDLVIVLAGDEGNVRSWVEQIGVQPGSHILFGTPAAVEPLARPYTLNPNPALRNDTQARSRGLIAGLNQTTQYAQLLSDNRQIKTDDKLDLNRRLSAQTLGALLLIVVVIVANVWYLARRRQ